MLAMVTLDELRPSGEGPADQPIWPPCPWLPTVLSLLPSAEQGDSDFLGCQEHKSTSTLQGAAWTRWNPALGPGKPLLLAGRVLPGPRLTWGDSPAQTSAGIPRACKMLSRGT